MNSSLQEKAHTLGYPDLESYHREAFNRNTGFLSKAEMKEMQCKRIAIPGLGGVGGVHLTTLIRTGFCQFNIADFDTFDVANCNRQYGAKVSNYQKPKLDSMINEALEINPYLELKTFPNGVDEKNIDDFLENVDCVIDSLDVFVIDLRILLYQKAYEKKIPVITAAPLGFGTASLNFLPDRGMTFDQYFGIKKEMAPNEKFIRFLIGLTPKPLHSSYVDFLQIQPHIKKVPSLGAGCQFAASTAAAQVTKLLIHKKKTHCAPKFLSIDPYTGKCIKKTNWLAYSEKAKKFKVRLLNGLLEKNKWVNHYQPNKPFFDGRAGGKIPQEVKEYLIQAAIQAPSGENTQPWEFAFGENSIKVFFKPEADKSFFNFDKRAIALSAGTAIENIKITATEFHLESTVNIYDKPKDSQEVAEIIFSPRHKTKSILTESIWQRTTNRKPYQKTPLSKDVIAKLEETMQNNYGAKLSLIQDMDQLKKLRKALETIGVARQEMQIVHEFLHSHIRWSEKEEILDKTGFPINNLEAGISGNTMLSLTKPWKVMNFLNKLGFSHVTAKKMEEGITNASACGFLYMPTTSLKDIMIGGMALEKVWLTLTELGISFQPMTTVNFFHLRTQLEGFKGFAPQHHDRLKKGFHQFFELFPEFNTQTNGHVMLFRMGYSTDIKTRTRRDDIKKFIRNTISIDELRNNQQSLEENRVCV